MPEYSNLAEVGTSALTGELDPAARITIHAGTQTCGQISENSLTTQPGIITQTFDYDGRRNVSVSMPSSPPEAIVYAGDGAGIVQWGTRLTDSVPTMIVGVHATSDPDVMARIKEYSPGFDSARFNAHEIFVVDEVRDWVRTHFGITFPPKRTAIFGASASGELALSLGIRHPEVFGHVFCLSPGGGFSPPEMLPKRLPRFYLAAGKGEPWFLENARFWERRLHAAGADVALYEREGEHGGSWWAEEFPRMVEWAFASEK